MSYLLPWPVHFYTVGISRPSDFTSETIAVTTTGVCLPDHVVKFTRFSCLATYVPLSRSTFFETRTWKWLVPLLHAGQRWDPQENLNEHGRKQLRRDKPLDGMHMRVAAFSRVTRVSHYSWPQRLFFFAAVLGGDQEVSFETRAVIRAWVCPSA